MVMLQPLAVAIRAQGERNIMVHTRGIAIEDVVRACEQLMMQLLRLTPTGPGPDGILGNQVNSLCQGTYEACGRRFGLVYRLLNEIMVVCLVPTGTCLLTAQRVCQTITKLLLLYFRRPESITCDNFYRRYAELSASIASVVGDNGHDHQLAFLEGEEVMRLLAPNSRIKSVSTLLGIRPEGSAAASRALERDYRSALADGIKNKRSLVPGPAASQAPPVLPASVAEASRAARAARKSRLKVTANSFTKPLSWGEDDEGGALKGLLHVSLPGFQVPDQILPNRLADPDGLMRPQPDEPQEEKAEEEEEGKEEAEAEAEVAGEEGAKVAAGAEAGATLPGLEALPGLKAPGALTLVEKWHAQFTGLELKQAALLGQLVCNERSLTCLCRLQVLEGERAVSEAVELAQADPALVSPAESGDALRLSVRAPASQAPGPALAQRLLLQYQVQVLALPPPFTACLQIAERWLADEQGLATEEADVFVRVVVAASPTLRAPAAGGLLTVTMPQQCGLVQKTSPQATHSPGLRSVQFVCPALDAGERFEAKMQLRGTPGPQGPCSYLAHAKLQLFGAPGNGTLTGTALEQGNATDAMESLQGQYMCIIDMKPVIQRY